MTDGTAVPGLSEETKRSVVEASGVSLGRVLANQAKIRPDSIAVVSPAGMLSYRELNRRVNSVAHGLLSKGVRPGDRVAVLSENRLEYVVLLYAAAKIGAAVAALNWRQLPDEIASCIRLVEPKALFLSIDYMHLLAEFDASVNIVVAFDRKGDDPSVDYAHLEASPSDTEPNIIVDPEACLTILYTSGTTGPSKGAAISHRALVARAGMMSSELGLNEDDAFIGWAPMFHMVTTDYMFITAILGGTFIVVPGFDVAQIVDAISNFRVGWFVLVPGTVDAIIEDLQRTGRRPLGIKAVGAMADLIPAQRIALLTELLACPFFNSFGSTETGTIPSAGSLLKSGLAPEDFGKDQTAFCDARIRTPGGREADSGEEGELLLRGLTMFSGYWNDDSATAAAFRDGWYNTGDVFTRSKDGKLHFAGRERYMIKSGGENVYPAEIERVLLSHIDVEEAVVARLMDEKWGEVPRAFVAVRAGSELSAADLFEYCNGKLARFMLPKCIEVLPEHSFLRNSTGKVLRSELEKLPLSPSALRR